MTGDLETEFSTYFVVEIWPSFQGKVMACPNVRSVVQDLALAVRPVVMRAALWVQRAGAPSRHAQSALKTTSASFLLT